MNWPIHKIALISQAKSNKKTKKQPYIVPIIVPIIGLDFGKYRVGKIMGYKTLF